jgi:hypothetical protein
MIKMRVSAGLTNVEYIGSFGKIQTSELAVPFIDADKTISCVIRNDETLSEGAPAYAQFAMLYTRSDGERMIRVYNYSWRVCRDIFSYFKSADVENFTQFKIRSDLSKLTQVGAAKTKEKL